MAESKLKLLKIIEILKDTDEHCTLTAPEICKKLEAYGITTERKSVCRDINLLIDSGYKIKLCNDKRKGYYMSKHEFDDWELKIMLDAVWQAKCITYENTKLLSEKLITQSSKRGQRRLKRIVTIVNKNKSKDSYAKEYIETLIEAMFLERKVSFQYTSRDKHMQRKLRYDGYEYKVSPYTVVWQNETYYLICNIEKYNRLSNFRLDRMENLKICAEDVIRNPVDILGENTSIKIQEYIDTSINHFSGEMIQLKLECKEEDMNILYDLAGENVRVKELNDDKLLVSFNIQDSVGLINWLMQYTKMFKVIEPVEVRENLINRLQDALNQYY